MNGELVKIYYSYNPKDKKYKEDMEKSLTLLRQSGLIKEWSEREIIAGQKISDKKHSALKSADIIIFLVSIDFLNSIECIKDWDLAKELASRENKKLVSIVLKECPWEDFDDMKAYLSLPRENKPLNSWNDHDRAWKSIYEEIRSLVDEIRKDYTIKDEFAKQISAMEFCLSSGDPLHIDEIFVFPNLLKIKDLEDESPISSLKEILQNQYMVIQGDLQSGKTTLLRHIFFELLKQSKHALYVDLQEISGKKPSEEIFKEIYKTELNGDYELWKKNNNKTIIFDNLSHQGSCIEHVKFAEEYFENIFVACNLEEYESYFSDDQRLTDYVTAFIRPFTHSKQEKLIKNWLASKNNSKEYELDLGEVDLIENNINSIIIHNRILPRYPFFILSILQTHEAFMPQDIKITAYGHCYYALIMAHLIKSGISKDDNSISTCLNFASHLAFEIYINGNGSPYISRDKYEEFKAKYKNEFIIQEALINRMQSQNGIIKDCNGHGYKFTLSYSYYYFLGKYLAENHKANNKILLEMIENNYKKNNSIALIFTIHHSNDIEIIDEILAYTMCAHDNISPAKLSKDELKIFDELLRLIPEKIDSAQPVEITREKIRDYRDNIEKEVIEDDELNTEGELKEDESASSEEKSRKDDFDQTFQCFKNIEILSQIIKNKFGSLRKEKVSEIVEIVCDAGLRLAGLVMEDDENLDAIINFIYKAYSESEDYDKNKSKQEHLNEIRRLIVFKMFVWVVINLEKTVSSINKPEIDEIVKAIKESKNTPAYDLIYYFYTLDTSVRFEDAIKEQLESLVEKYESKEMEFIRRILSIRTQHYLSTHNVKTQMRQTVSSILKIAFKPKPLGA